MTGKLRSASLVFAAALLWFTPLAAANKRDASAGPTFSREVAPILYDKCVSCHRPGEIAPMSLLSYEEARPWAKSIARNVRERSMPPWHADPGYGPFANDRSLSDVEIATLVRWVKRGAPEGNPEDLPAAPDFGDGSWKLGEPDYIVEFERIEVPAGGPDRFYNLVAPTHFDEDKWVRAVEILPGNRDVVHHVILWQGDIDDQQGWLGAWAGGVMPDVFAEGTGRLLRKGSSIVGDMHYHPTDTAASDVTRVGLYFADDEEIEKELINLWVMNVDFEIPPGDPNYEARATHTFAQDSHILAFAPHLHYRGKDFSYTAHYPDGRSEDLLRVSNYDFNWQTIYKLEEPIAVPKGTRIECVAHWDNSKGNPHNPDPARAVRFGNESYDEMMIGFLDYVVDEGVRPEKVDPMPAKLAELQKQFPHQVYQVEMQLEPGGPMTTAAVHLPREGDGAWYVSFQGLVFSVRIEDLAWEGDALTAKMMIPGDGLQQLSGNVDSETGILDVTMTDPQGRSEVMTGVLLGKPFVF